MNSNEGKRKKEPKHCPLCGAGVAPSDEKCPKCDVNLDWVISQMSEKFVERSSHRVPYASVVSEDGKKVKHEMEPGTTVECPECGFSTSIKEKECSDCGESIEEAINQLILEEMLNNVDDTTFELKDTDKESIINNIRQFASLMDKPREDYDVELSFMCPLCGTEVSEDMDTCPGCGALFED